MKKAIQKAIEGGWQMTGRLDHHRPEKEMFHDKENSSFHHKGIWFDIRIPLSDPLFWQALGKAEGWEVFEGYDVEGDFSSIEGWRSNWHRFIDHLAEGKDVDSFFNSLLK